jgi:hypothetical protein
VPEQAAPESPQPDAHAGVPQAGAAQAGTSQTGSQHFGAHSSLKQFSFGIFSFGSLHFGRLILGIFSFGSLHFGSSQQVLHLLPASQTPPATRTNERVTTHSISFLNISDSGQNGNCIASTSTTACLESTSQGPGGNLFLRQHHASRCEQSGSYLKPELS